MSAPLARSLMVMCLLATAGSTFAERAAAQSSAAASADTELATIRRQMEEASFRDAATGLEAYLGRTDLDAAHRNAALELDAVLSLARRDEARASQALAELYGRDPGHRLEDPDASPVVLSAFARARESATPPVVRLETDATERLTRHEAPTLGVRVTEGGTLVHELRVSYRAAGTERFTTLVVAPEGQVASATLPITADPGAQTLEVFVEALAPSGYVLGAVGSASAPERIEVPAASSTSGAIAAAGGGEESPSGGGGDVTGEWWLWTLVGIAVVGAGVGIGVGVALSEPGRPTGTLGGATLPLVSF